MREITFFCILAVCAIVATNPAYLLPMAAGLILAVGLAGVIGWRRYRKARNESYWSDAGGWGDLGSGLEDHWDYSRRDSDETQGG
jgi:hypothetical protein